MRYKLEYLEKLLKNKNYEKLEEISEIEVDRTLEELYVDFRIYVVKNSQNVDYVELNGYCDDDEFEDEKAYYICRECTQFRKYNSECEDI